MTQLLLALNVGSSSLKFRAVDAETLETPRLSGVVERVGAPVGRLTLWRNLGSQTVTETPVSDHLCALTQVAAALAGACPEDQVIGVAHRIVHGGALFTHPVQATQDVLAKLDSLVDLAPLHLPHGVGGIRGAQDHFPEAVQVACFDTGFHATKPWDQSAYALPRRYYDAGVRRYGFHGISCQSIVRKLRASGYPITTRKLVIAHLGNGCSVTAVAAGQSIATSMGFSTLDGLTMGTRSGRIDPGVLLHLMRQGMTATEIETLLYRDSGLLGLSGLSNDMRDLEASEDPAAQAAIDYFIARLVEEISRLAGVLGGLDTVVFCGGIGENAANIRAKTAEGLGFLPGLDGQGVEFRVENTDEEAELLRALPPFLTPH